MTCLANSGRSPLNVSKTRHLINPIQAQRSGAQCGAMATRRGCGLPVVPEMAYFGFTNKLLRGETIQIYNYGNCRRDFTNMDDIVEGIVRVMQKAPARNGTKSIMVSERKRASPPSGGNPCHPRNRIKSLSAYITKVLVVKPMCKSRLIRCRGYRLLRGCDQMHCREPVHQWQFATVHDSTRRQSCLVTAFRAPTALGRLVPVVLFAATFGTNHPFFLPNLT